MNWQCPHCNRSFTTTRPMLICPRCRWTPPVQPDPIPVIDTTVPVRAKRRTDLLPVVITVFCLCGLLFIGLWYVTGRAPLADAVKQTADHMAVATWLRENTNSGTWEEVRWYPTVELTQLRQRNIQGWHDTIADKRKEIQIAQAELAQATTPLEVLHGKEKVARLRTEHNQYVTALANYEKQPVRRLCGIKFRAVTPFGGKMLFDQLFDVTGKEPLPINAVANDPSTFDRDELHKYGWEYLKDPSYDPDAVRRKNLQGL